MDFAVLADHRVKIYKYLDFTRELKKLWNMKIMVIPIVAGALGTVLEDLEKRLGDQEMRGRIDTIQTTALIGKNTEKSPGDMRKFAITQTTVENHKQMLVWKLARSKIIIYIYIITIIT